MGIAAGQNRPFRKSATARRFAQTLIDKKRGNFLLDIPSRSPYDENRNTNMCSYLKKAFCRDRALKIQIGFSKMRPSGGGCNAPCAPGEAMRCDGKGSGKESVCRKKRKPA